jgi:hypothetical protein
VQVGSAGTDAEWSEFIGRLAAESDAPRRAAVRVAELPSYQAIPFRELLGQIRRSFIAGLTGLTERRMPGADEDVSIYEQSGEARARAGVTLADMILCWTMSLEVARADAFRWAPAGENRDALLLEAVELMTAWNTLGMNASTAAHRRVELQLARQENHDAANLVRSVLLGGTVDRVIGQLERFGIDPARAHYAVRVRPEGAFDLGRIERWLGTWQSSARPNGLVGLIDGDVAGFVADPPADSAVPVCAGLAGPTPLSGIADAFRLASRALDAARAVGRTGLTDLGALGLLPSVLSDADVARSVLDRYVRPVEQDGRGGITVLKTVESYLAHDCLAPETATALGVHPNTVRYRIGQFEQLTGCSLRHTESLVEVWWALRRYGIRPPGEALA